MTEPSELERIAETKRYLDAIDVQRQRADEAEREVARLSKIEAAARAYCAAWRHGKYLGPTIHELEAALTPEDRS